MDKISNAGKMNPKVYQEKQMALKSQLVEPKSIFDLQKNANIKAQQCDLAQLYGDLESLAELQTELDRIRADITRVESEKGNKKTDSTGYLKQLEALAGQIKPQADGLEDLKFAAKIKQQLIDLAIAQGDSQRAGIFAQELARINADIAKYN